MGPQNASKDSRQLFSGGVKYSPSDRANTAVRAATSNQVKSSPVVGEQGQGGSESGGGNGPTTEKMPKQNVGGSTPSEKAQANARYIKPGNDTSVNDEKA